MNIKGSSSQACNQTLHNGCSQLKLHKLIYWNSPEQAVCSLTLKKQKRIYLKNADLLLARQRTRYPGGQTLQTASVRSTSLVSCPHSQWLSGWSVKKNAQAKALAISTDETNLSLEEKKNIWHQYCVSFTSSLNKLMNIRKLFLWYIYFFHATWQPKRCY